MDISSIISTSGHNLHGPGQRPEGPSKLSIEEMAQQLIEKTDKDGNGMLDAAELCISEDVLNQVDANGDGQLNAEELIEGAKQIRQAMGPPPGLPMMKAPDEDDNNKQTLLDLLAQNDEETPRTSIDIVL